jgi:hypothetical protein
VQRWNLALGNEKRKQTILEKIAFYIPERVKTTKNSSKTCDSTISEIFGNKVEINREIVSKSLKKPVLLFNTAIFTLQIIEKTGKQYSFQKQRQRVKISNKMV